MMGVRKIADRNADRCATLVDETGGAEHLALPPVDDVSVLLSSIALAFLVEGRHRVEPQGRWQADEREELEGELVGLLLERIKANVLLTHERILRAKIREAAEDRVRWL